MMEKPGCLFPELLPLVLLIYSFSVKGTGTKVRNWKRSRGYYSPEVSVARQVSRGKIHGQFLVRRNCNLYC